MDFSWTPEQEHLRKNVIKFAEQSLQCDMIKHDRECIVRRGISVVNLVFKVG